MKMDLYTKVVLALIAMALGVIAWNGFSSGTSAYAQEGTYASEQEEMEKDKEIPGDFRVGEEYSLRRFEQGRLTVLAAKGDWLLVYGSMGEDPVWVNSREFEMVIPMGPSRDFETYQRRFRAPEEME